MRIRQLVLQNFRNFPIKKIEFADSCVIVGENTHGKTNILESIYYLSTGKSFRASKEEEVILEGQEYFSVSGEIESGGDIYELRTFYEKNTGKQKKLQVNKVNRNFANFGGILKSILFIPEDFNLVQGSPEVRRRYLDGVLVQVDKEYRRQLSRYKRIVYQRNRLLNRIREGLGKKNELEYWDQELVKNGCYLQEKRDLFISFMNKNMKGYGFLKNEKLVSLNYLMNEVSQARIIKHRDHEVAAGVTLIGPHRDDLEVTLGNKKVSLFGSRGEQRLTILSISLTALDFVEAMTLERPVLLLDDVFSELDHYHRESILGVFNKQQTIMTTTEWDFSSESVQVVNI